MPDPGGVRAAASCCAIVSPALFALTYEGVAVAGAVMAVGGALTVWEGAAMELSEEAIQEVCHTGPSDTPVKAVPVAPEDEPIATVP